jgi:hypothetical protein
MRSKAHTTPTATLVLNHTVIVKCAMKKFGINGQLRNKLFLVVIHRFSLVKAAMNAWFLNPSAQWIFTAAILIVV